MTQITHIVDAAGCYRQVVTPATLRRVLDDEGSSYSRPDHFCDQDEWDAGDNDGDVEG